MSSPTRQHEAMTPAKVAITLNKEGIALGDRQFAALINYLQGDSKSVACEKAGLNANASWSVFSSPKMHAAMALVIERFLVAEAAPAALRALYNIVGDTKAAPGVRVTAANSLLDRAGFDTKRLAKQGSGERDAQTMTADELRAEIARLEREQEARMRDVSPDSEPSDSYAIDFP